MGSKQHFLRQDIESNNHKREKKDRFHQYLKFLLIKRLDSVNKMNRQVIK